MKVRDLIEMEIDIDVVDDVTEELYIAFCGPLKLTLDGKEAFGDVLDCEVKMRGDICIVCVDGDDWEHKLQRALKFFRSAAGYCNVSNYEKWFLEEN